MTLSSLKTGLSSSGPSKSNNTKYSAGLVSLVSNYSILVNLSYVMNMGSTGGII